MKVTASNLTKLPLPSNTSGDVQYADAECPGLYVRVRASGDRSFVVRWREGQFHRRIKIGTVGVLSLEEARKKARKTLVGIDEGKDPIAIKAKARADSATLFLPLAREYLDARAKDMKPQSLDQCRRHLEDYWKPLHRLPLNKIEFEIIAAQLRVLGKKRGRRGGAVAADRGRSTLSAFFAWAIGEGYCKTNPVDGTNVQSKSKGRDRILTPAELAAIWNAAPEGDYGTIVKLLMLTAQRRDEIASLQWPEIIPADAPSAPLIALPPERTKNSRPHHVPLSDAAWSLLKSTPRRDGRDYVFGEGQGGFSGFSRAKDALDVACGAKKMVDGKLVLQWPKEWTLHDLRRTADTLMGDELDVLPHITEAILNHVSSEKSGKAGVAGVYNKATYMKLKRDALDRWASHLMTIIAQAGGANVTRLRAPTLHSVGA